MRNEESLLGWFLIFGLSTESSVSTGAVVSPCHPGGPGRDMAIRLRRTDN